MCYKFENCANSVESAIEAQKAGADRVELCAGMPEGGTTPSYGEILMARKALTSTKLNVIIRPRGGDFLYNDIEKEVMLEDIRMARKAGVDGLVFGALTKDGDVDMEFMCQLMKEANNLPVTFHRAFDVCRDPFSAMEQIIKLGCARILTSGQETTADMGIGLLKQLVQRAGERIIIMPGCGVNSFNIVKIAHETGAREFHFSGRSKVDSKMEFRKQRVSMGGTVIIDEFSKELTDALKVKETIAKLK